MSTYRFGPRVLKGVLCALLSVVLLLPVSVEAQTSGRRSLATVIFCGLGGAVVGLSTLSFYGKPQDHTGNIYMGLGLGLIAGTAYVFSDRGGSLAQTPMESPVVLSLAKFDERQNRDLSHIVNGSVSMASFSWEF